ncbi:dienelactone hydrolase family protein [Fuerstiella marisgermanici]|uniref:Putative dienelactone hydrolase n=1 Tax=Fuerstiella marisgermanici TaxID=1891926 RepID=A0A1P8WIJ7_9PLAN|nr:dienelactone hydrolase family protein [Fuerstiella marisgermanici]APZ93857.1 putative dienelactone hydrolase [Fuerstiella marisgermanici]
MKSQLLAIGLIFGGSLPTVGAQTPANTKPLTMEGDLASQMVDGIDRFLLRKIDEAPQTRDQFWDLDTSSVEAFNKSIQPNRERLAKMLGVRDGRIDFDSPERVATVATSNLIAVTDKFRVFAIGWPVLADPAPTAKNLASIYGEGLMLVPDSKPIADVVAIPHADHSPEQICGLAEGVPAASQYARRLAESGCRVIVPTIISRERSKRNGRADMTDREYLHRAAFELGRHLIGYEVQKVMAAVDWFEKDDDTDDPQIGVIGYGDGGMLALYAGALDTRIDVTCVSGAMGFDHELWKQPLDRNVFGLVREFGTAELATMIQPRGLVTDFVNWPEVELAGDGGAPAELKTPSQQLKQAIHEELDPAAAVNVRLVESGAQHIGMTNHFGDTEKFCDSVLGLFITAVAGNAADANRIKQSATPPSIETPDRTAAIAARHRRQFEEIDRHNQALLRESPFVRKEFMSKLDTSSVEAYEKSVEAYRDIFRKDVIGEFDEPLLPFNARSRQSWETEKWTGHEVVLDVFPDVFAYGVLLLPKDLKPGEKRPVVVCQHGLEGRPTDTFLDDHRAYHDFAAKLCEQGFITFAPQNPYIFKDRFRTLQRKANPLGKTLFSIIVPQHQQIVNWLKTQPNVDPDRIGFYGLSYGGKSAMRIPALVTDYALSICSADFNEWVRKNASTRLNYSYMWTGEYEIFEWDLGSTFNYFEMAALICPRPFMVERGHFDGVGTDDWVAYEYAKIRHLYAAKLGIAANTEIEWFVGPHTINGKATFDFLHRHLHLPPISSYRAVDERPTSEE